MRQSHSLTSVNSASATSNKPLILNLFTEECFLSSGAWPDSADKGSDLGRVLSHTHGWVIQTEGVDDLSDEEVRLEAAHLEQQVER